MWKKSLACWLVAFILHTGFSQIEVVAQTARGEDHVVRVKAEFTKIGLGNRTKLRLSDERQMNGYVSDMKADSFVFVWERTGGVLNLNYSEVINAKRAPEKQMSKGMAAMWLVIVTVGISGAVAASMDR